MIKRFFDHCSVIRWLRSARCSLHSTGQRPCSRDGQGEPRPRLAHLADAAERRGARAADPHTASLVDPVAQEDFGCKLTASTGTAPAPLTGQAPRETSFPRTAQRSRMLPMCLPRLPSPPHTAQRTPRSAHHTLTQRTLLPTHLATKKPTPGSLPSPLTCPAAGISARVSLLEHAQNPRPHSPSLFTYAAVS